MPAVKQIFSMLKQTFSDWSEDKAPKLAAALALYTMLSIGPLMVIVLKLVGVLFGDAAKAGKVQESLSGVMPGGAAKFVEQAAHRAGEPGEGTLATIVSFAILAFTATGVFAELQDSMNTIWEVRPKPNRGIWGFVRQRLFSFAMVLGIAFLFMVSTIGTTALTMLADVIVGDNKAAGFIIGTVASLVVMSGLFAMIFKLLPDVQIAWKDVILGAVLTAVLFEIGKFLLSWYLQKQTDAETSVYGAAGSLAALLLYIYYSAQILFFGAEFTQVYAKRFGSGIRPADYAEPMTEAARAQQGLRSTSKSAPTGGRGQQHGGRIPAYRQPAPSRQVVTIEQPSQMNRQGYLLAAGGLAAGFIVGAAGIMTGRKWGEPRLSALQINQRLDAVEDRIGKERSVNRYGKELALAERVAEIERHVDDATKSLKRKVDPPWYVKLAQPREKKSPPWYSRIREYVS